MMICDASIYIYTHTFLFVIYVSYIFPICIQIDIYIILYTDTPHRTCGKTEMINAPHHGPGNGLIALMAFYQKIEGLPWKLSRLNLATKWWTAMWMQRVSKECSCLSFGVGVGAIHRMSIPIHYLYTYFLTGKTHYLYLIRVPSNSGEIIKVCSSTILWFPRKPKLFIIPTAQAMEAREPPCFYRIVAPWELAVSRLFAKNFFPKQNLELGNLDVF